MTELKNFGFVSVICNEVREASIAEEDERISSPSAGPSPSVSHTEQVPSPPSAAGPHENVHVSRFRN